MRPQETEPKMTRVGIPVKKPERREVPAAPPLPVPVRRPAPVIEPPVRTPELVPAGR